MAVPGLPVPLQRHVDDGRVVLNLQLQQGSKVLQVTHHCISVREEVTGVASEKQPAVVAEERVPVVAEVELAVGFARVPLVDADELAVARVEGEEAAGSVAPLKDDVIPAGLLEEIGRLQARGAGPDDAVVVVEESGTAHPTQAAGIQGQPQQHPAGCWGHGGAGTAAPVGERTGEASPRGRAAPVGGSLPTRDPQPGQSLPAPCPGPAAMMPPLPLTAPSRGGGVGAGPCSLPANSKRRPRSSSQWADRAPRPSQ